MKGMANEPGLRANILVHTTGLKEKIARKKSWTSAAEDLDIALKEGETSAAAIVSVFHPDDRVRHLDGKALWAFLVEDEFWLAETGKQSYGPAKEHLAFLIERALKDSLIDHRAVVDGVSVAELATRLPKAELGKIIEGALSAGAAKRPFTEVDLLAAMPPSALVDYVPLKHLWDKVVAPKIAETHGYSSTTASTEGTGANDAPPVASNEGGARKASAESTGDGKPRTAESRGERSGDGDGDPVDWVDAVEDASLLGEDELSDDDFS